MQDLNMNLSSVPAGEDVARDSQKKELSQYFLFISTGATYVDMQQKQLLKLFLSFIIHAGDEVTCFKIMLLATLEHTTIPTVDNTW